MSGSRGNWALGRSAAVGLACTAAIALLSAQQASAAQFTLAGAGHKPAIAVDDSGTAHIAWTDRAPPDDQLVYCRLPRGATACSSTQSFALPRDDNNGPRVLLGGGEVILLSMRCCSLAETRGATTVVRSADGGNTFTAPKVIGDNDMFAGEAVFGPGEFQVSTVGAPTEGTVFQATPLGATPPVPASQRANLEPGPPTGPATDASIGFLDPLTPIVAWADFAGSSFFRVYDGAGSYNDVSNWLPKSAPIPGIEPQLASGQRGTYLLQKVGEGAARQYVVRRFDQFAGAFSATTTPVSKPGEPIFRDFIEDSGGHLHAAWVDNAADPNTILYRRSTDGQSWSQIRELAAPGEQNYNLEVGAAGDGGGWAVWNTESGGGAVMAAPFDPIGPNENGGGAKSCGSQVTYGKVVAIAQGGSFEKKGSRCITAAPVRLNGLDFAPEGGAKIEIDTKDGTMTSTGKALVRGGNVELDREKLAFKLPKGGGELRDLAGNPAVFDAGKSNAEILGLPVSGWVTLDVTGAGTALLEDVDLRMPAPFASLLSNVITLRTSLRLDNANGLVLAGAELGPNDVYLGIAEVRDLHLLYVGDPGLLQGEGTILLPVIKAELATMFGLDDGGFDYGNAVLTFDPPGRPVSNFAYLREVSFGVNTDPTRISGGVVATGGPTINLGGTPTAAVTVDGTMSYQFTDPGVFIAQGDGLLFNVPAASAKVEYVTTGKLTLENEFSLSVPPVSLDGTVNGEVALTNGAFNLLGTGEGCGMDPIPGCIGVEVLVSSKAAAGCASVDPPTPPAPDGTLSAGAAYKWGGGFDVFAGCDLDPYKATVTRAEARSLERQGAAPGFDVGAGLNQVNVAIRGAGAPPRVTITGPDGASVVSSTTPNGSATGTAGIITQSEEDDTTYAALMQPASGRWSITPNAGSPAVTEVLQADALPDPSIQAKVERGKGRKRTLEYEVRQIPGQTVEFLEVGAGGAQRIGEAKGRRGKLGFSAADGPGGPRTIEAHVESFEVPRDVVEVATYRAPGPIKPGKPGKVRVRRRGSKAQVSWSSARDAHRYVVEAALADGRRLAITTRKTKTTIGDVPGIDAGKIKVASVSEAGNPGKVATARLKAKPKRRKKGKR